MPLLATSTPLLALNNAFSSDASAAMPLCHPIHHFDSLKHGTRHPDTHAGNPASTFTTNAVLLRMTLNKPLHTSSVDLSTLGCYGTREPPFQWSRYVLFYVLHRKHM
jgi:hypothetical protein